jgi:hypothetical protein
MMDLKVCTNESVKFMNLLLAFINLNGNYIGHDSQYHDC